MFRSARHVSRLPWASDKRVVPNFLTGQVIFLFSCAAPPLFVRSLCLSISLRARDGTESEPESRLAAQAKVAEFNRTPGLTEQQAAALCRDAAAAVLHPSTWDTSVKQPLFGDTSSADFGWFVIKEFGLAKLTTFGSKLLTTGLVVRAPVHSVVNDVLHVWLATVWAETGVHLTVADHFRCTFSGLNVYYDQPFTSHKGGRMLDEIKGYKQPFATYMLPRSFDKSIFDHALIVHRCR